MSEPFVTATWDGVRSSLDSDGSIKDSVRLLALPGAGRATYHGSLGVSAAEMRAAGAPPKVSVMMSDLQRKNFGSPDEVRPFPGHGHVDLVNLDSGPVGLGTFEPGWRWSTDIKPMAGTDSCQVEHVGYVLSGRMKVVMDDGQESEVGPGDAFHIPSGHDAWTLGDEACTLVDFGGLKGYAQPAAE